MSITEKEPVVEQPSDDIKIEDSEESASESPTTSPSHAEKNNQNNNKVDIDYLDSNLLDYFVIYVSWYHQLIYQY